MTNLQRIWAFTWRCTLAGPPLGVLFFFLYGFLFGLIRFWLFNQPLYTDGYDARFTLLVFSIGQIIGAIPAFILSWLVACLAVSFRLTHPIVTIFILAIPVFSVMTFDLIDWQGYVLWFVVIATSALIFRHLFKRFILEPLHD